MEEQQTICQNCESPMEGSFSYCPNCGQKTVEDLTFGVLFNNTISNYFSYDARFLKSFVPLVFKPGFIARQFVNGKRLKYLHPAQYYLFVSVVFFFLFSISTRSGQENVDKMLQKGMESGRAFAADSLSAVKVVDSLALAKSMEILENPNLNIPKEDLEVLDSLKRSRTVNASLSDIEGNSLNTRKLDSLIAAGATKKEKLAVFGVTDSTGVFARTMATQGLKLYESSGQGILAAFYDTIPISMFFLIPIFALILKLLYYRRSRFAHSMVFSFYFFTFLFIVLSLILLVNFVVDIPDWIDWLVALSTIFYLLISLKRFYGQGYFITIIKLWILSFTYLMFVLPFSFGVMVLATFLLY
ncbi:DUF3667 domain-containing protein [Leptobacterium flavescens]|uniref:DUF3667 domain-containing protein n=1 Tax=Leptobacterium flavescens TaxID=472055 RepID=A0A6P0UKK5_9FLAO|nr:DUF3667 domain-containing protein [Leptobacterium flavescens]NER13825.1 DUF3667 domain-containing protein [Leptobacterium flavescens]